MYVCVCVCDTYEKQGIIESTPHAQHDAEVAKVIAQGQEEEDKVQALVCAAVAPDVGAPHDAVTAAAVLEAVRITATAVPRVGAAHEKQMSSEERDTMRLMGMLPPTHSAATHTTAHTGAHTATHDATHTATHTATLLGILPPAHSAAPAPSPSPFTHDLTPSHTDTPTHTPTHTHMHKHTPVVIPATDHGPAVTAPRAAGAEASRSDETSAGAATKDASLADCNTLQHTATHCNTLLHTATHCNTLQHTAATTDASLADGKVMEDETCRTRKEEETETDHETRKGKEESNTVDDHHTATRCNTLQHTATRCNTLQHTATHGYATRKGKEESNAVEEHGGASARRVHVVREMWHEEMAERSARKRLAFLETLQFADVDVEAAQQLLYEEEEDMMGSNPLENSLMQSMHAIDWVSQHTHAPPASARVAAATAAPQPVPKIWDGDDDVRTGGRHRGGSVGSEVEGGSGESSQAVLPLPVAMQQCLVMPILRQYDEVSVHVMALMLRELQLETHLRALRRYFFAEDGLWARGLAKRLFGEGDTLVGSSL